MRARVCANLQSVSDQQLRNDLRGRTLAVGASDVDNRVAQVRLTHQIHKGVDVV